MKNLIKKVFLGMAFAIPFYFSNLVLYPVSNNTLQY